MKLILKNISNILVILIVGFSIASCGDKATFDATTVPAGEGARVRFHNAVPNGTAGVFFAGETKISAILNTVAYGPDSIVVGGVFPVSDYAVVPAGAVKYSMRAPSSSTQLVSQDLNLASNTYYSVITVDTVGAQKILLVTDDRSAVKDTSKAYFRIINAVNGVPNGYDFYLKRQGGTTNLVATVKSFEASSYIEMPFIPTNTQNDSLFIRAAGGSVNVTTAAFVSGSVGSSAFFQPARIRNFILRGVSSGTTIKSLGATSYYVN